MQFRLIEFEDHPRDQECAIEIYKSHQFPTVRCRAVDLNFTEFHFRNDGKQLKMNHSDSGILFAWIDQVDLESRRQKSTEAEALHRLHGLSVEEACKLVCLPIELYRGADVPLDWLPAPNDIEKMVQPLRKEKELLKRIEREEYTPPLLRGENA